MKEYSYSKEDFLDLLIKKYVMDETKYQGCLWDWAENTDYVLCNGDWDLLPPLVKKDEIRYEYNQYANKWSWVSCTVFAAMGMLSDLINYEFSYDQIKEVDELTYTTEKYPKRTRGKWYYVKYAVAIVADRYNNSELSKKYGKVAYYRLSKYSDEIIEDVIDKLYTIDWNMCPNAKYNQDKADWMLDGTDYWKETNWHSLCVIKKKEQRSVKDSWSSNRVYGLKHKLSEISNFWANFYVYTLVKEDNLERVKKLNEIKAKIVNWMGTNSELWNLSWSKLHKNKLHEMNNFFRDWLSYIDGELKELQ